MFSSTLLVLAACSTNDGDLNKVDAAPGVSFVDPADGALLPEGEALTFVAAVEDDHDALEDMIYAWSRQDGSALIGTQEYLDGQVRFTVPDGLPDGEWTVTLEVTDAGFNTASDTVLFTVVDNTAPSLSFVTPETDAVYSDLDDVVVDLLVEDPDEDDMNAVGLAWSGDLADGAPAAPTSDGHARYTHDPVTPGAYTLSVIGTDSLGSTAYAEVSITVVASDNDGDGYVGSGFGGDDCDDDDASVHPGADETCNEVDDDCDGAMDEDAVDGRTFHLDTDGDAYGDPATPLTSCNQPSGYVMDDSDCADDDADIHPGADETCNGLDDDCDGTTDEDAVDAAAWHDDLDGDSFGDAGTELWACDAPDGTVADDTDCDDVDPGVNPDAEEVCNTVDDDCDGVVDDAAVDAPTWYADTDGDTHGAAALAACEAPVGYVDVGDDCDDSDTLTFPGAPELCDGRDNDCDGAVDEDVDPSAGRTWYADSDGDGHGGSTTTTACAAPSGYADVGDDCDDGDASVFPGADEHCNDVDDDCDGAVDDAAVDATDWYADADGDHFGDDTAVTRACDAPSGSISVAGDCDDGATSVHPGATEVCNGEDDDCDGAVDDSPSDGVTWYADTDGDGWGDASSTTLTCTLPAGYAANDDDCDDTRNTVSPSAVELCNDLDDDCDGTIDEASSSDATTWYADADSDGYGSATSSTRACDLPSGYVDNDDDCNDASSSVSPGKGEICDAANVDEDCDGVADDADASVTGKTTWHLDHDADGYGSPAADTTACDRPAGYAATDIDCDDDDAAVNPYASELCNSQDDDCDGLVDDADPSLVGGTAWYRDADSDGYGDLDLVDLSCAAPSGYVASSTDCDDTQGAAHPGATETCDTAFDDDCDGSDNDPGAVHCADFYADVDGDGFGDPDDSACLCEAEAPYASDLDTDCDDTDADVSPGAFDVCENGVDEDCDGVDAPCPLESLVTTSDADLTIVSTATNSQIGQQISFVPDMDGDGTDEIVIASLQTSSSAGGVWLVPGESTGTYSLSVAPTWITGGTSGDAFGSALAGGDFDGDGIGDLLVGATLSDEGGSGSGGAWVFLGPLPPGILAANSYEDLGLYGASGSDYFGSSVTALADVDADGADEVAVGAMYQDGGGTNSGAVFLQFGPITTISAHKSSTLMDAKIVGEDSGDYFGVSSANGGDFDGDGLVDLLIGAYGEDLVASGAGAVYVASGVAGFASSTDASTLDWKFGGDGVSYGWSYSPYGHPLAGGGDLNLDGYDDFVVGSYQDDTAASEAGAAYVVLGRGGSGGAYAMTTTGTKIYGEGASDEFGYSVSAGSDVDGDGFGDFLVSALLDDDGGSNAGAVYLYYGAASSSYGDYDAKIIGDDAGDYSGISVASNGDANGDGLGDVLVGAYLDDEGYSSGGTGRLFLGGPR